MNFNEERSTYTLYVENEPHLVSLTECQVRLIDYLIKEHGFDELLDYKKLDNKPPRII